MAGKASSANKQPKKSKLPSVICPICEEAIIDATARSSGHDSIECKGLCKEWLHRGCAGLSKAAFLAATVSPNPFLCPRCRLVVAQSSELSALKSSVNALSLELSSLKVVVDDLKANITLVSPPVCVNVPNPTEPPSRPADVPVVPSTRLGNHETLHASKSPVCIHPTISDKKYNIVLFGVDECSFSMSRQDRFQSDLSSASEVLSEVDSTIQKQSIKDCFRLGKFNASSHRSRPILVKFIRSADASSILSKRASLIHPFHVKPDLTREERHIDALLLKERWNLIQSGTGRKYIKIKNGSIFVSNKLHSKVVDSVYQAVKAAASAEGGLTADDQDRDSSPDSAAPRARSLSPPPDPTSHTE